MEDIFQENCRDIRMGKESLLNDNLTGSKRHKSRLRAMMARSEKEPKKKKQSD